jgi:molybdate transport system substrate-binding protein
MTLNTDVIQTFARSAARVLLVLAGLMLLCMFAAQAQLPGTSVKLADAPAGSVRLFVSSGLRAPLEAVRAEAEKAIGRPLAVQYAASRLLQAEIEQGQAFELAILTGEVIDELIGKGKIVAGSRADLARVLVAIARRGDVPAQDIGATEALKAVLLGAKSIRFSGAGASRPTIDNMFAKLDLGTALKSKIVETLQNADEVVLGAGEYQLLINLASEFRPDAPNLTYLGAIPAQFQVPVVISAGVGNGGDVAAARALIGFLKGSAIEPALKANRMVR